MRSKKALKNIITLLILQIVTLVCGFIVPKAIIENFGSSVNGLMNSITHFLAYITLLESGFGPVVKSILYRPIAQKNKEQIEIILKSAERFFRTIALIFIIYIVMLCFMYPMFVNNEFDTFYTISLILIIGISTFAEYFFGMTYRIFLQAEQKAYIISIIQIVTTIINTIMIIILINLHTSIQVVKLVSATIFIFRPILQNIYVKKKYGICLKKDIPQYTIKQRWNALAQHISGVIHANTDVTVLTLFSKVKEISVYSVYYMVVTGVKNIISVLSSSIESTFGDMIAKDEKENLNKKFSMYEFLYFMLTTIIFSCTMVLIVPFVRVYTLGITDIEYARPIFSYIFVASYYILLIKAPYNSLAGTAGKFKETRKGAILEAGLNLGISVLLVQSLGLIGIAIGTFVSVFIRTIEMIVFTSKEILNRKLLKTIARCTISILQMIIITVIGNIFIKYNDISYLEWVIKGCEVFMISLIVIVPFNCLFYKEDLKESIKVIKNIYKGKKE